MISNGSTRRNSTFTVCAGLCSSLSSTAVVLIPLSFTTQFTLLVCLHKVVPSQAYRFFSISCWSASAVGECSPRNYIYCQHASQTETSCCRPLTLLSSDCWESEIYLHQVDVSHCTLSLGTRIRFLRIQAVSLRRSGAVPLNNTMQEWPSERSSQ